MAKAEKYDLKNKEITVIKEKSDEAYKIAGILLEKGNYYDALDLYKQAKDIDPSNIKAKRRYEKVKAKYNRMIEEKSKEANKLLLRRDYKGAKKLFKEIEKLGTSEDDPTEQERAAAQDFGALAVRRL